MHNIIKKFLIFFWFCRWRWRATGSNKKGRPFPRENHYIICKRPGCSLLANPVSSGWFLYRRGLSRWLLLHWQYGSECQCCFYSFVCSVCVLNSPRHFMTPAMNRIGATNQRKQSLVHLEEFLMTFTHCNTLINNLIALLSYFCCIRFFCKKNFIYLNTCVHYTITAYYWFLNRITGWHDVQSIRW